MSTATAGGYTLLAGTSSRLIHNIALFEPLPVDIRSRLKRVAMMNEVPMVMCVNPAEDAPDLPNYIEKIKADRIPFQYGVGPAGTTTHISGVLFLSGIGVDGLHVPCPESGEAMRDLIAGRLSFVYNPSLTTLAQVKGGAVRSFGVAASARLAAISDGPTMPEAGLPDFVSQTWNTIAAPAYLPDGIVAALNEAVNAVGPSEAIRTQLEDLGSIVSGPKTSAEVDACSETQRDIWIPITRGTEVLRTG